MKAIIDEKYGALIISNAKIIYYLNDQVIAEFDDGSKYIINGEYDVLITFLSSTASLNVTEISWFPEDVNRENRK